MQGKEKQPAPPHVTSLDDGKVFIGNGAECMVRFIADGCKGKIYVNDDLLFPVVRESYWDNHAHVGQWKIDWMEKLCTYHSPEPQWHDATTREAVQAYWIDGKDVEYRLTENAPIEATREWKRVTADYKAWADPHRVHRIREG